MKNFNYNLTKFFIERPKLVVLGLIILIFAGLFATLSLRTTGFPNATLGILTVQTVYPGASAETIAKDITSPIEEQIKSLNTDIDTYNSTSANSFSVVVITLKTGVDVDTFRNKLDAAVSKAKLPTGVDKPSVSVPSISADDYQFSIASGDKKNIYDNYQQIAKSLKNIPEIQSVSSANEVKKRISVVIDTNKLKTSGVTIADIKSKLSTIDESLPVVSGVEFSQGNENVSQTIVTSLNANTLDDIKNYQFQKDITLPDGSKKPITTKLSDVATLETVYEFEKSDSFVGLNPNNSGFKSLLGMTVSIKGVSGVSGSVLSDKIDKVLSDQFGSTISKSHIISSNDSQNTYLVRNYVVNDDTQKQVGEVVSGLVGGNLEIDNNFKYAGWILGGIQLIVLVMILFVSWRAALIGALAIPLSLIFSNIYLFARGETLNTLVLFSLVLVVGLVVDPALVMLEAVQRKYDVGLKGNDAILAAIKDVGNGIFLASLTNIIVFLPFAIISGVLGQIFSYIPLTIIPATIGSYFVPILFLSWLAGKFLKPSKSSIAGKSNLTSQKPRISNVRVNEIIDNEPEFQNMWNISKYMVKLNYSLLTGSKILRAVILILGIVIPFVVAGYFFGNRLVKSTQFSQVGGNGIVTITYVTKPDITAKDSLTLQKLIFDEIGKSSEVAQIFPYRTGGGQFYFARLDERKFDETKKVLADVRSRITNNQDIMSKLFDVQVAELSSAGGGGSSYQVNIAVKSSDLEVSRVASLEVAKVAGQVCYSKSGTVNLTDNCEGTRIVTKVDDGFTDKENKIVDIIFDRNKIAQFQIANTPATFMLNQTVKGLYQYSTSKVGTVNVSGDNLEIYLKDPENGPKTIEELSNMQVMSMTGQMYKLSDIAQIVERNSKSNITKLNSEQLSVVQIRLAEGYNDQGISGLVTNAIVDHFTADNYLATKKLSLDEKSIESYSAGGFASFLKSFSELSIALLLAIIITYIVLCVFFDSLLVPITILYTIPLTFIGIFPALAYLATGEFGFLEIIGLIILVGIVENVAIFLIDSARTKISEGWDSKSAIAFASGIRFRPVILTTVCAIASLAPLALFSPFYRSLSLVIMFGLATSGVISLITTPLLFIAFRREKSKK